MASPTDNVGFLTFEVARLLRRRIEQTLDRAGLGLTSGEARTLAYAARFEGSNQSAIADLMGIEPMTLVGFLDKLEARGLVERVPDPADRRAKLVRVTAQAAPIVQFVSDIATEIRNHATQGMSPDEVERLRLDLHIMRTNLLAENLAETDA
ncbi:DNA-binding MarR family transcriptional regulator [Rhodoligotrophos appendicifer]|uniref:MarR family winged helix-turn-helix transcriptional regulator n=1 Tax=Rhodoligotrophos appendicifer TaxID=987056 RepID=UPI0011867A42|nr:MarR family transcriptional regulator [Rhodoligotrophos appendicifer]